MSTVSNLDLPSQCNTYSPSSDADDIGNMAQGILSKIKQQGCDLSSFYAA